MAKNEVQYSCCRRDIKLVRVTVGSISLINPDPEEQKIEAFSFAPHPQYNATNKLNDIALIEVTCYMLIPYSTLSDLPFNL